MPKGQFITIVGLGAGSPDGLTLGAWRALSESPAVLLRTARHPVVEWLGRQGISFETFDYIYEEAASFAEVYQRIAAEVLRRARLSPVLYAVPGHPLVAEESVRLILKGAQDEGIGVEILPAESFLDAVFTALKVDPSDGLQVLDGLKIDGVVLNAGSPAIIAQVYSRLVASNIKLSLLEHYPPEHEVVVVRAAGVPGEERVEKVRLFELDRLDWLDHLTCVYLPPYCHGVGRGKDEVCEDYEDKDIDRRARYADNDRQEDLVIDRQSGCFSCRYPLDPLMEVMKCLRGEGGCPWDKEQDHRSLRPYLLEEAYEVLEALSGEDMHKLCEELGDLLLQIAFHAHIAAENGNFNINDVVLGITEKMIRRHPHVFGSVTVSTSDEVLVNWQKIKAGERGERPQDGLLSGVPRHLPALMRAARLQKKAASVGFDWPEYRGALQKVREELAELESAIVDKDNEQVEREVGDLLFAVVNVARLLGVEAEAALAAASEKFVKRFSYLEKMAAKEGRKLDHYTLAQLDEWWEEAKKLEKN